MKVVCLLYYKLVYFVFFVSFLSFYCPSLNYVSVSVIVKKIYIVWVSLIVAGKNNPRGEG